MSSSAMRNISTVQLQDQGQARRRGVVRGEVEALELACGHAICKARVGKCGEEPRTRG